MLPYVDLPFTMTTGFSTTLAKIPNRDPFLYQESPFDDKALRNAKFIYARHDSCKGNFANTTTSDFGRRSEHLSIALGVSIGNDYLNAGVTGSYDSAVLENKNVGPRTLHQNMSSLVYRQAGKSSRRCTYDCGTVRPFGDIALSTASKQLLETGGLDAFTQKYGDYYVGGLTLGGDSGVLLTYEVLDSSNVSYLKIEAEATFLCWTSTTTLAEESINEQHASMRFGITAFDTLDQRFVNLPNTLTLEQTRRLASEYGRLTEDLPARVLTKLEGLKWLINPMGKATTPNFLGYEEVGLIVESGLVVRILLLPFKKLREVRPYLK